MWESMRIVVSACLLGEHCKYNGGDNRNERVLSFLSGNQVIPVCPEVLGGLSVPRSPAEIVRGVVTDKDGGNVDEAFRMGAEKALLVAQKEKADIAILQSRSPSCGVKEIYDGSFTGKKIEGMGVFAKSLKEAGIPVMDAEDVP
jgi:uncharacterized protein YbbK (DUF523 family)